MSVKEKIDRKMILELVEQEMTNELFGWGEKEEPPEPEKLNIEPAILERFMAALYDALEIAKKIRITYPEKHHAKGKRKFLGVERLLSKLIAFMEKRSDQSLQEASFGDPLPSDEEIDALISQHGEPETDPEDEQFWSDLFAEFEAEEAQELADRVADRIADNGDEDDPRVRAQGVQNLAQEDLKLMSELQRILSTAAVIGNEIGKNKGFEGVPKNFAALEEFINNAILHLQNSLGELTSSIEADKEEELRKVPDWLVGNTRVDEMLQAIICQEINAVLLEEGIDRREFIRSLGQSAAALGLAACIGPGCDFGGEETPEDRIIDEENAIVVHVNNKLGGDITLELDGVPIGDFMVGECEEDNRGQCSSVFRGESSYGNVEAGFEKRCGSTVRGPSEFIHCPEITRTVLLQPGKYRLRVVGPGYLEPLSKDWGGSRKRGNTETLTETMIDIRGGRGVERARELRIQYEFQPLASKATGYQAVITARLIG